MKFIFDGMLKIGDTLNAYLEEERDAVNVKDLSHKFTCECCGKVALGLHVNAINDSNSVFRRLMKAMFADTFWGIVKIFFIALTPTLCRIFGIKQLTLLS